MIDAADAMKTFLEGAARLCGAESATLFVPPSLGGAVDAQLIHSGGEPLPELASREAALEFVREASSSVIDGDSNHAVVVASELAIGRLVPILPSRKARSGDSRAVVQRRRSDDESTGPIAWLGLRLAESTQAGSPAPNRIIGLDAGQPVPSDIGCWLVELGGALAAHHLRIASFLHDSVAGLPGRAELQGMVAEELARVRLKGVPLTLAFINPDDFGAVNERFGREAGDRMVREIADRIVATTRRGDFTARFGGAIFAIALVNTPLANAGRLGARFRVALTRKPYLDGAVRIGFSIGMASVEPDDDGIADPLDLVRRADQALGAAKRAGGDLVMVWSRGSEVERAENLDRLSGVFTGNMSRDYRNMVMLWDVLGAIASIPDLEGLTHRVMATVFSALKPDRVVLFECADDELHVRSLIERRGEDGGEPRLVAAVELPPGGSELLARTHEEGTALAEQLTVDGDADVRACAVPIAVDTQRLGCLFLDGMADEFVVDGSDIVFLRALGSHLAMALDRARLADRERDRQEDER